jgi:hypothetical protein
MVDELGSLNAVKGVAQIGGCVVDTASESVLDALAEKSRRAWLALGVTSFPLAACVEIEVTSNAEFRPTIRAAPRPAFKPAEIQNPLEQLSRPARQTHKHEVANASVGRPSNGAGQKRPALRAG